MNQLTYSLFFDFDNQLFHNDYQFDDFEKDNIEYLIRDNHDSYGISSDMEFMWDHPEGPKLMCHNICSLNDDHQFIMCNELGIYESYYSIDDDTYVAEIGNVHVDVHDSYYVSLDCTEWKRKDDIEVIQDVAGYNKVDEEMSWNGNVALYSGYGISPYLAKNTKPYTISDRDDVLFR